MNQSVNEKYQFEITPHMSHIISNLPMYPTAAGHKYFRHSGKIDAGLSSCPDSTNSGISSQLTNDPAAPMKIGGKARAIHPIGAQKDKT